MKEGVKLKVGEKIKKFRKERGLTQKDLASRLNTTPQNLAQYENGKRNPKPETLQRIAIALNIDMQYLLPDADYTSLLGDKAAVAYSILLEQILGANGYTFGITEDTDSLYINYPDGILKISEEILNNLEDDILSYVKFRMQQLKKENMNNFVSQQFFDYTTGTIKPEYKDITQSNEPMKNQQQDVDSSKDNSNQD